MSVVLPHFKPSSFVESKMKVICQNASLHVQVEISCPLLRDALLLCTRFGLENMPNPPNQEAIHMPWILRYALERVDMANLLSAAARTKTKLWSEYIWQGEVFSLIKSRVNYALARLMYR